MDVRCKSAASLVLPAISLLISKPTSIAAQRNFDEAKVPHYTLPDPLVSLDGRPVASAAQWKTQRRQEIVALFEDNMYGRSPAPPADLHFEIMEHDRPALDGSALRTQVRIHLSADETSHPLSLLIYRPPSDAPVPVFLGLNSRGNQTVLDDPQIELGTRWSPDQPPQAASERSRGRNGRQFPVATLINRGYALATMCAADVDPDFDDGFLNGVHGLLDDQTGASRPDNAWGTIAAWAWGLSRALDYIETDGTLDARRVAVFGHSRLGKAALWAGARDERFAMTISNNSGGGGAALARRRFGETIAATCRAFPHWFCANYREYAGREDEFPVDQHLLISLLAPRLVYVASAEEDRWADPKGEYLAARHAAPVYALLGVPGLVHRSRSPPEVGRPLHDGRIGYHIRSGTHGLSAFDWRMYLAYADRHLRAE